MIKPEKINKIDEKYPAITQEKYPSLVIKEDFEKKNEKAPKEFKRKWKIPLILNKIGDDMATDSKKLDNKNSVLMKKEFVEWSLLTKFDCYSKIFENEIFWVKIVWLLLFLLFTGFTAWLVIFNIINYFHYEVTSIIEVKNERPSNFPAITICNNNPFTSLNAQSLMDNFSNLSYGKIIDNMTFLEAYTYNSNISEYTKMYVNSPFYNDINRSSLAAFSTMPYRCFFNGDDCSGLLIYNYFRSYFSYDFGNCWQFNTGYNYTNSPISLLYQSAEGSEYGLTLMLGPWINLNKYFSSFSDGLVVFVHNQSHPPSSSSAIRIETGKETNIALGRTFTHNQASPYTECQDLSSFSSELYNLVKQSNYSYRQSDCFDLCLQKNIINSCGCYYTRYTRMYDAQSCNLTQYDCVMKESSYLEEDKCISQCPLECDSITYQYSISSLVFPSQSFYNKFFSDKQLLNYTEFLYGINVSTYEAFQKYYVMLNVFYPLMQYTEIKEIPKFTPIDLLSQIGGSLGMFLGFSIFHLIELFEILIIILHIVFKKSI